MNRDLRVVYIKRESANLMRIKKLYLRKFRTSINPYKLIIRKGTKA